MATHTVYECPRTAPSTRFCRRCLEQLPADQFPRQDWHRCRECIRAYQRDWSRRRSARRRRQEFNQVATKLQRAVSHREVEFVLQAAFTRYGGAAGFAEAWGCHLDESPAGSRSTLLAFAMIARLMEYFHATTPSFATMTDDELAREVHRQMAEFVNSHPNVVVSQLCAQDQNCGDTA